jgi:hypothetical protein
MMTKNEAIEKAKSDIQEALRLKAGAPETAPLMSGIKTKADYQRYTDETQEWIDRKLLKAITQEIPDYILLSTFDQMKSAEERAFWNIGQVLREYAAREAKKKIDEYLLEEIRTCANCRFSPCEEHER